MAPFLEEDTLTCDSSFDSDYSPTKALQEQQDACSNCITTTITETATETKPLHAEMCKPDDPFLYYSNDEIRLKSLKCEEVSESISLKTNDDEKSSRKTRISFEVHSSVYLEDMMDEMFDDSELDFDAIELNFEEGSKSDLLRQLLQC